MQYMPTEYLLNPFMSVAHENALTGILIFMKISVFKITFLFNIFLIRALTDKCLLLINF